MKREFRTILCFTIIGCAATVTADEPIDTAAYRYYLTGNAADVVTETQGLVVMQGGGDDVDENYRQMARLAGHGDFVVLSASGADDYNDYLFELCDCDSVETIVFQSRDAAYERRVVDIIRNAEAIFFEGGDQSNYVRYWKGTPVEDAIHFVAAKPAPIGGTSAGMAILGEYAYSAMTEASLTSAAALSNPYHEDLTLETDFLALDGMQNLLTDQHLAERDRIGRTVTMLARLVRDGITDDARAVAADRETAAHLDPVTGNVTVHTTPTHETPYVYFLRLTATPTRCEAGQPLSVDSIDVYRVAPGGTFNVRDWTGTDGLAYTFSVKDGVLVSSRGEIY